MLAAAALTAALFAVLPSVAAAGGAGAGGSGSAGAGGGAAGGAARRSGKRRAPLPTYPVGAPLAAAKCPFDMSEWRADTHSRLVTELVPEGRLEEAFACARRMMGDIRAGRRALPADQAADLASNEDVLTALVSPRRPGVKRVYHNVFGEPPGWPANSSEPLPPRAPSDAAIQVTDGVLTPAQCDALVRMFEAAESFDGNLFSNGVVVVDHAYKKAREFDISDAAHADGAWAAAERVLLSAVHRLLAAYERANPVIKTHRSPLDDEGFRMKRYVNDGTEHHGYHADSGQEPLGAPRRLIAVLIYANDVAAGGETVFLNQGVSVAPRCGRAALFPAAFPYVHAGRRPVSGNKYVIADFITLASGTG